MLIRLKSISGASLWLLLLVLPAGCSCDSQTGQIPGQIKANDFRGETIYLEQPAERVVCLIESALSGIYMLGQQDKLVGIPGDVYRGETWRRYAELDQRIKAKSLPTPGNWDFVSIEQVVGLEPDLVIIWASQIDAIENLESLGIPVYAVMLHGFEDVFKEIDDFGKLLGCEERAGELIGFTRKTLEQERDKYSGKPKKSVYFMWAQGINETSGTESTVNDLLQIGRAHV